MKLRQFVCIAAVFGIFALSVFFTFTFSSMFWQSFEDREKIIDMDVSTYQVKYSNVWEKMKVFSQCENKFEQINVKLSDENKRELVKRISSQIGIINKYLNNVLPDISEDGIKSCTQYVNYGNSDTNGFSYWYLVYCTGNCEITMIADTEFMTIYKIYMTETVDVDSVIIHEKGKLYRTDGSGSQITVEYAVDWSDYEVHNNLFLEFYKMTMNKMPEFGRDSSSHGITIYAVYHDDSEGGDVEIPFLVSNTMSGGRLVFEWGMMYFDSLIQQ